MIRWLVVIDFPDERINWGSENDHMHVWMDDEGEARQIARVLTDRVGGQHEVIEADAGCPRCRRRDR